MVCPAVGIKILEAILDLGLALAVLFYNVRFLTTSLGDTTGEHIADCHRRYECPAVLDIERLIGVGSKEHQEARHDEHYEFTGTN